MSTTPFSPIAAAYDLLLDDDRLSRELPGLRQLLAGARRICDLGCGSGEHLAALEAPGLECLGIDADPAMVAVASARHQGLDVRIGDLAQPPAGPWDALLCLGNVLACIAAEDLPAVATAWRQALATGGRAVVQLVNPRSFPGQRTVVRRDQDRILIKTAVAVPGGALLSLLLHRQEDGAWHSHASHQRLHHHDPDQLAACFRSAGFAAVETYGGLDLRPFSDDAPGLVLRFAVQAP